MNKNTSVIMALVILAVLVVGIAGSVTQSVLAARNVACSLVLDSCTEGDSGGNGGATQTGGTVDSGPATGGFNTGTDTAKTRSHANILNQNSVIIIGESNAVGCGHIGGSGSSGNKC